MNVHEINSNPNVSTHHCIDWTLVNRHLTVQPGDMLVVAAEWRDWKGLGVTRDATVLTINDEPGVLVVKDVEVTYDETAGARFARAMDSVRSMKITNDWVATVLSVHVLTMMARASLRSSHYDNRCWPKLLTYVSCPQGLRWVLA